MVSAQKTSDPWFSLRCLKAICQTNGGLCENHVGGFSVSYYNNSNNPESCLSKEWPSPIIRDMKPENEGLWCQSVSDRPSSDWICLFHLAGQMGESL